MEDQRRQIARSPPPSMLSSNASGRSKSKGTASGSAQLAEWCDRLLQLFCLVPTFIVACLAVLCRRRDARTFRIEKLEWMRVTPGSLVEIIGSHQTLDTLAADAGTISYEILTRLGHRYCRHYC
ncbi:MAG: hypothetical protein K2Q04_01680 [Hyphomicrobium sp.]|nr:hypothetical protein [Hyphomicrobium sp.]